MVSSFGFDASIDGQLAIGMEFRRGLRLPSALTSREQELRAYSCLDGLPREKSYEVSFHGVRYRPGGARLWLGDHPYAERTCVAWPAEARAGVEFGRERRDVVRRRAGGLTMTTTKPDVDLTDGAFYADDSRSDLPVDARATSRCSGTATALAAAATYAAVIEAERNPELFSNAGGIRPDQPGVEMMIEMDDPQHLLRRKLVNAGFTRKRVKDLDDVDRCPCATR